MVILTSDSYMVPIGYFYMDFVRFSYMTIISGSYKLFLYGFK